MVNGSSEYPGNLPAETEGRTIADPLDISAARMNKILARSGLRIFRGRLTEEYLHELRPWAKASKVYLEMMDDSVVGALLDAIYTPLLATEFQITPATDTTEDKNASKFLHKCLMDMSDMEWREHVEEALTMLAFGFSLHEIVLEKKDDGKVYLRSLLPIGAETVRDWGDELDELGNFKVVRQQDPTTAKIYEAPKEKLLHFTFRGRKKNPEGHSLLRSVYRPWYFKKNLEVVEAIGVERDVGNVPIAELPEDIYLSDEDLEDLQKNMETFRVDEAAYFITPPGVKINAYGGGNKVYNVRMIIRDYQHLIRQRFFANFIAQGSESVGTQALAKELTSFFGLVIRSIQTRMLEVWKRQLIPTIFKYNNFSVDELPRLGWKAPGKDNIQSLSQAVVGLTSAKILTPSEDIEEYMRKSLGFPPLPDGMERASDMVYKMDKTSGRGWNEMVDGADSVEGRNPEKMPEGENPQNV